MLALWTPCAEDSETDPPLVQALSPPHPRDEWVALVVGEVYLLHALPVAWQAAAAEAPESWVGHFRHLLCLLAPAVPAGMPMHILCDRVLGSRKL